MSANLLTTFELEALIAAWEQRWGDEYISRSGIKGYRFDNHERLEQAFEELIRTLVEKNGYEINDFARVRDKVIEKISPDGAAKTKQSLEKWRNIRKGIWIVAQAAVFGFQPAAGTPADKIEKAPPTPKRTPTEPESEIIDRPLVKKGTGFTSAPEYVIDENEDLLAGIEDEE